MKWNELLKGIDDVHLKSVLNLMYVGIRLDQYSNKLLKPAGISHQQFDLLKKLELQPNKNFSLKEIQQQLINQTSNATRLVEKLRLKGYLQTSTNKENRSKLDIKITKKGLQFLQETVCPIQVLLGKIKENISDNEAKMVFEVLTKIENSLE